MLSKLTLFKARVITDDVARDSTIMAVFTLLAGLFNFLYQLSMGMMLTPVQYGTLVSFLSIFAMISLFSQAIQISVTKFTSKFKTQHKLGGINYLRKFSLQRMLLLGAVLFILVALFTPIISRFLKVDNYWYCLLFSTSLILVFAIPVNCGILQGLQKFVPLGISTALIGFLKLSIGALLVYVGWGVYGGLVCLILAVVVVLGLTRYFLRDVASAGNESVALSGLFSYTGLVIVAVVSFGVLTNIDVILVKHYLSPESAGNYAVISVLGRIALFAPLGVALAIFPKTSDLFETSGGNRAVLQKAIFLTVLLVGGVVVIFWLASNFIINLLFSDKYPLVAPYLFRYTLAMALFAFSFLMMNYFLSLNQTKVAYSFLGVVVAQVILLAFFHNNINEVVNVMLGCGALSLLAMFPFYIQLRRSSQ